MMFTLATSCFTFRSVLGLIFRLAFQGCGCVDQSSGHARGNQRTESTNRRGEREIQSQAACGKSRTGQDQTDQEEPDQSSGQPETQGQRQPIFQAKAAGSLNQEQVVTHGKEAWISA